jgi:hypothetical protein
MAENLYGQVSYGYIVYMNCFALWGGLRFMRRGSAGHAVDWPGASAIIAVSMLLAWNNPQRALVTLAVPFTLALAAVAWPARRNVVCPPVLIMAVAMAVGALCHLAVLGKPVQMNAGVAQALWLEPGQILRNASYTVLGALAHLGEIPPAGASVVSAWGVYAAVRMVVAACLLGGIVMALRHACTAPEAPLRLVGGMTLASAALVLLFHLFTTVPDMNAPLISARYMVPAIYGGLLLLPLALSRSRVVAASLVLASAMAGMTLVVPGVLANGTGLVHGIYNVGLKSLVTPYLQAQGLHYGYATYWNAGVHTVVSGGDVKVRQVVLDMGLPLPMLHLASRRWYRPSEWQGESFLMLEESELAGLDRAALDHALGPPSRILHHDRLTILVYPFNLSGRLAAWSGV